MQPADIASRAPTWTYFLLVALLILGLRALKTREVPLVAALIAPAVFSIWSLVAAGVFAGRAGVASATAAWVAGAVVGATSVLFVAEPRGARMLNGRLRQPGSWLPLILYLGVFVARFACGTVAAMLPAQATTATAIGIAVSAAMTARLLVGVAWWEAVSPLSPTPGTSVVRARPVDG